VISKDQVSRRLKTVKNNFDAFETHPVKKVDGGDSPYDCFEQCEPDDPEIYAWAVYGHTKGEGIECLADCATREKAEFIKAALEIAYLGFEDLRDAAQLVLSRWSAGDLAAAVRRLDSALCRVVSIVTDHGKEVKGHSAVSQEVG
jgi:hypothetical protein